MWNEQRGDPVTTSIAISIANTIVFDRQMNLTLSASETNPRADRLRVAPDIAEAFHNHMKKFCRQTVIYLYFRRYIQVDLNPGRLRKAAAEPSHSRNQAALTFSRFFQTVNVLAKILDAGVG